MDLLAVQGTLKSLLQHHSSKASIHQHSAFFIVQLSHPYITTRKTIRLTRWTFVSKVMFLLFNMLSRLVTAFLPRSKHLLFIFFFIIIIFLVLPLYCYQPISLHPCAHMLSHVIPWTSARQTPLSMDFSRQEYWSGLPFPSPHLLISFTIGSDFGAQENKVSHCFHCFPMYLP